MPVQKRSQEGPPGEGDGSLQRHQNRQERTKYNEESDRTGSSTDGDKDELVAVELADMRKEVQCPICLGIIWKTRTVMECLHRFCRECIDKSMRLGNNECPACRAHCASRRSLRDDPNYDALIAVLYPDIDKYEEEELARYEEEKARNKQIQASIAEALRRQSEALGKKRTTARATATAFIRRSQGNYYNLRERRNHQAVELQGSDDGEECNGNDEGNNSPSADESLPKISKPKRCKRWGGSCNGDDSEVNRESAGAYSGLVSSSERLAWGRGVMRSHTRYGSSSGGDGKNARNSIISKLIDFLRILRKTMMR